MANTYFQCKEFIVHQQHTSMKVCTDACLFGAWVSQQTCVKNASSLLDIGTGTGLLSLMVAQVTEQNQTKITAVEIEPKAADQAATNFKISKWNHRLVLLQSSIQEYTANQIKINNLESFDVIITNPPFYEGSLKSPDSNKNKASHSTHLTWENLINNTSTILKNGGSFFALVPTLRAYTMQQLAEKNNLCLIQETLIYNNEKQLPFRSFLHFQKSLENEPGKINLQRNKIVIKGEGGNYSKEFTELLKNYYLHL